MLYGAIRHVRLGNMERVMHKELRLVSIFTPPPGSKPTVNAEVGTVQTGLKSVRNVGFV